MMRPWLLALSLFASIVPAFAYDINNFFGSVFAPECSVSVQDEQKRVFLGSDWSNDLEGYGVGSQTRFSISLENCPIVRGDGKSKVTIRLNPTNPMDAEQGVLANTAAKQERAENVGVQLLNDTGQPLNFHSIGQGIEGFPLVESLDSPVSWIFAARLYAQTGQPITAGKVSASLPFIIDYQ